MNCIHPIPGTPEFSTAEILYIDAKTCIDCGACVEVCPVDAIRPNHQLAPEDLRFRDLSQRFFEDYSYDRPGFLEPATRPSWAAIRGRHLSLGIVGTGPAGVYAAEATLEATDNVDIHFYERQLTPWGLVRSGVAPDHQDTKDVIRAFERIVGSDRVTVHLNVEIGRHLTHEELMRHHHAVVCAVGAGLDRTLGIPGEQIANCTSARQFVAWYNGDPAAADSSFDLSHERVVVVGNGNVALDVARILAMDPAVLRHTDIADHALAVLRASAVKEVVVLGRRGPSEAAYTTPELLSLAHTDGIDLVIEAPDAPTRSVQTSATGLLKSQIVTEIAEIGSVGSRRTVVLRFHTSPVEILGADSVTGVRVAHNELIAGDDGVPRARPTTQIEDIACGLVVRAVGYSGSPIPGLPFDRGRGVLPQKSGRVMDGAHPMPGAYTAGWIKRGPSGVIGTNRTCAQETVSALLSDFADGRLPAPTAAPEALAALLAERQPAAADLDGWHRIDAVERARGRNQGRPRVKLIDIDAMLAVGGLR